MKRKISKYKKQYTLTIAINTDSLSLNKFFAHLVITILEKDKLSLSVLIWLMKGVVHVNILNIVQKKHLILKNLRIYTGQKKVNLTTKT